jgi:hypothetical protein
MISTIQLPDLANGCFVTVDMLEVCTLHMEHTISLVP